MKTKKFTKKLDLNKRTVSFLNQSKMSRLNGGAISGEECYTDTCTEFCHETFVIQCGTVNCTVPC